MRVQNIAATIGLGCAISSMPGCIAWDIHEEMQKTNAQLADVKADLQLINQTLEGVKGDLARTNTTLEGVKGELATTNTTMADVQGRLAVLDPIQTSLLSLDDSLKTVKGLIEKIPFVGGGDGEEQPDGAAPSTQPDGSTAAPK
jgi:uncharacterized protein (DUF3084 family)